MSVVGGRGATAAGTRAPAAGHAARAQESLLGDTPAVSYRTRSVRNISCEPTVVNVPIVILTTPPRATIVRARSSGLRDSSVGYRAIYEAG